MHFYSLSFSQDRINGKEGITATVFIVNYVHCPLLFSKYLFLSIEIRVASWTEVIWTLYENWEDLRNGLLLKQSKSKKLSFRELFAQWKLSTINICSTKWLFGNSSQLRALYLISTARILALVRVLMEHIYSDLSLATQVYKWWAP